MSDLTLRRVISLAAELNPGDTIENHNSEYVRGQAELIMDMFGMDHHESRDLIVAMILGE